MDELLSGSLSYQVAMWCFGKELKSRFSSYMAERKMDKRLNRLN